MDLIKYFKTFGVIQRSYQLHLY